MIANQTCSKTIQIRRYDLTAPLHHVFALLLLFLYWIITQIIKTEKKWTLKSFSLLMLSIRQKWSPYLRGENNFEEVSSDEWLYSIIAYFTLFRVAKPTKCYYLITLVALHTVCSFLRLSWKYPGKCPVNMYLKKKTKQTRQLKTQYIALQSQPQYRQYTLKPVSYNNIWSIKHIVNITHWKPAFVGIFAL